MKGGTKLALGILAGVTVGGTAGYFIATSRLGRKAIKEAEDVIDDPSVRLPDPSYAVELPYTDEQFEILDELVCECGDPLVRTSAETATIDQLTVQIQDCVARELYPDFPWPPMVGDHPSAAQLYVELGVIARRALIMGEICPHPVPKPIDIPVPRPPGDLP